MSQYQCCFFAQLFVVFHCCLAQVGSWMSFSGQKEVWSERERARAVLSKSTAERSRGREIERLDGNNYWGQGHTVGSNCTSSFQFLFLLLLISASHVYTSSCLYLSSKCAFHKRVSYLDVDYYANVLCCIYWIQHVTKKEKSPQKAIL